MPMKLFWGPRQILQVNVSHVDEQIALEALKRCGEAFASGKVDRDELKSFRDDVCRQLGVNSGKRALAPIAQKPVDSSVDTTLLDSDAEGAIDDSKEGLDIDFPVDEPPIKKRPSAKFEPIAPQRTTRQRPKTSWCDSEPPSFTHCEAHSMWSDA